MVYLFLYKYIYLIIIEYIEGFMYNIMLVYKCDKEINFGKYLYFKLKWKDNV